MDRRSFGVRAALAAGWLGLWPDAAWAQAAADPWQRQARRLSGILRHRASAERIGRAYLQAHPAEARIEGLVAGLTAGWGEDPPLARASRLPGVASAPAGAGPGRLRRAPHGQRARLGAGPQRGAAVRARRAERGLSGAMLIDARELEAGALLEGDLCVVGAGAAGIAIALRFADTGHRVLLLESGGLEFEDATQALYEGTSVGQAYYDLDVCRLRFFGGTTNHWEGRCRPLDPLDFEVRPGVPHSGWPISRASLDPHYARAQELCQLGPYDYRPDFWLLPGEAALPFDPAKVTTGLWQFSPPTRFGEVYLEPLTRAANLRVVLHANLVDIETGADGAEVQALQVATL